MAWLLWIEAVCDSKPVVGIWIQGVKQLLGRGTYHIILLQKGCNIPKVDLRSWPAGHTHLEVSGPKHSNIPLTMDTSAREAMKDAAKCDKHCELQISANQ